jgi:hypothetical protein
MTGRRAAVDRRDCLIMGAVPLKSNVVLGGWIPLAAGFPPITV